MTDLERSLASRPYNRSDTTTGIAPMFATTSRLFAQIGVATALLASPATALPFSPMAPTLPPAVSQVPFGAEALAPLSYVRFCIRNPQDCEAAADRADLMPVLAMSDLDEVNVRVNRSIRPRRKVAEFGIGNWVVNPTSGDCNDYAVTKRHELLKRGWPANRLMLSVVETSWGEGHLVLTVRTENGDVVLDNLRSRVLPWHSTGYRWIKLQSSENPANWVEIATAPKTTPAPAAPLRSPADPSMETGTSILMVEASQPVVDLAL